MRNVTVLLIILAAVLASCSTRVVPVGPWVKKVDAEDASRLVLNFAAKMKKEQRLELEDSRLVYDDFIKKWYLEFSSQRLVTVVEARLLIVELVEEFLSRVNNHTLLSFEVERAPFSAADLEVKINFESFYGFYIDELYMGSIWLKCGCVYFYAFDRKDNMIDWDHHRWEPYFKSRELALLKKEADLPFLENPSVTTGPKYLDENFTGMGFGPGTDLSPRALEERRASGARYLDAETFQPVNQNVNPNAAPGIAPSVNYTYPVNSLGTLGTQGGQTLQQQGAPFSPAPVAPVDPIMSSPDPMSSPGGYAPPTPGPAVAFPVYGGYINQQTNQAIPGGTQYQY